MTAARYWRVVGLSAWGDGPLELSALHLCDAKGVRVDAGSSIASTLPPASGLVSDLQDADLSTSVQWLASAYSAPGFAIVWILPAPAVVGSLKAGSSNSPATWIDALTLQFSADGITWQSMRGTGAVSGTGAAWPGARSFQTLGGSVNFPKTVLAMRLDMDVDATTLIDDTGLNSPNLVGAAVLSAAQYASGGASAFFNGSDGNAIQVPITAAGSVLNLNGNDFTVSMDVYYMGGSPTDGGAYLFVWGGGYNYAWPDIAINVYPGGSVNVALRSTSAGEGDPPDIANFVNVGVPLPSNRWVRVQLRRAGNLFALYFNADLVWSKTDSRPIRPTANAAGLGIGGSGRSDTPAPKQCLSGYIDNVMVINGIAVDTLAADVKQGFAGRLRTSAAPLRVFAKAGSMPAPSMQGVPVVTFKDVEFGGMGRVFGTVSRKNTPANVPLVRRVRLHRSRDGLLVRETWSKSDGTYEFSNVAPQYEYDVVAWDHELSYRSVVANNLKPEV